MVRTAPPFALAAFLAATAAFADGAVTVEVGKTATVDVGLAKGLNCDDLSVADVQIRTRSAETNQLVVTGLKPGKTWCRAGMPNAGATALVGGQWQDSGGQDLELRIVNNQDALCSHREKLYLLLGGALIYPRVSGNTTS